MKFLLDTCVLSDFAKGDRRTRVHVDQVSPGDVAVSTITEMEILYGLRLNPRLADRLRPIMEEFFRVVHLLPFDRAAARVTSELRASLKGRGAPIGSYDALIAGIALSNDLILVTSNVREFQKVADLRIQDWRR